MRLLPSHGSLSLLVLLRQRWCHCQCWCWSSANSRNIGFVVMTRTRLVDNQTANPWKQGTGTRAHAKAGRSHQIPPTKHATEAHPPELCSNHQRIRVSRSPYISNSALRHRYQSSLPSSICRPCLSPHYKHSPLCTVKNQMATSRLSFGVIKSHACGVYLDMSGPTRGGGATLNVNVALGKLQEPPGTSGEAPGSSGEPPGSSKKLWGSRSEASEAF